MAYASETTVPVEKSAAEIERILDRYGASQFMRGTDRERGLATIQFFAQDRHVRFILRLPIATDKAFTHTPTKGDRRTPEAAYKAWEQACRQKWRALALCIKAKLEAVDAGISVFEEEFLAHIVLPGAVGTVGAMLRPQIAAAYTTGEAIPGIAGLLPAPEETADYEQ